MGLPAKKMTGFGDMLSQTATVKKPAGKKSTMPVIEIDETVRGAVDSYVNAKAAEKTAKASMDVAGTVIIEHTREVQDKDGFAGKYNGSYQVKGNLHTVKFISTNRFSINPEDEPELRQLLGDAFDELFVTDFKVTLKPEVFEDDNLQGQLMNLIGEHFGTFFDTVKSLKVCERFDELVYRRIKKKDMDALRTFCRQYKPSLR